MICFQKIHALEPAQFRYSYKILYLLILIAFVFPLRLVAQSNFTVKVLSGKDSSALANASVTVSSSHSKNQSFTTDEFAIIKFSAIPPVKITVYKPGFKLKEQVPDSNLVHKIYLDPLEVNIEPVTVSTAQFNERPVENSLYKVKVISSRELQMQAPTNLRDILNNQLNLQINTDPILGSSLQMQGLSGQNIKILIDGIAVAGRENGNIDLSQVTLANIDHIEIIEGPVSTIYGADALGGVINLITKTGMENPLQVNLNTKYESTGTYNADGSAYVSRNKSTAVVFGGRNFFDGYSPIDTSRAQLWNPREQFFGGAGYTYRFRAGQVRYKADLLDEKIFDKGQPVITPYEAYAFDNIYRTQRYGNSVFFNHKLSNGRVNAAASHQWYNRMRYDYYKNLITLENRELQNAGDNATTINAANVRADYSSTIKSKNISWLAGADFNYENGRGAKIPGTKVISDYAAMASMEYTPVHNLHLQPSARLAYNTIYGKSFIPAFNAKYVFRTYTSLRVSVAKGYRAPSLKELYLDFVDVNHNIHGNINLQPENSVNYRAGLEHARPFNSFLVKVEPSVFFNDVKNIITLALTDAQKNYYTYINTGAYRNYGYGITSSVQTNAIRFEAGVFKTATYNFLSQYFDLQDYITTPEYRLALLYTHSASNLSAGVYFKYVGQSKQFALGADTLPYLTGTNAFSFLDFSISKKFYKAVTITTGIKNILGVKNVRSAIISGTPHAGTADLPVGMGAYFFAEMKWQLFKGCFKK